MDYIQKAEVVRWLLRKRFAPMRFVNCWNEYVLEWNWKLSCWDKNSVGIIWQRAWLLSRIGFNLFDFHRHDGRT